MVFVPQALACLVCGRDFQQQRWGQKYCGPGCRSKRKNPAWNRGASVAGSRRRRARRATTWDGVTDAEILERDRWMCGICRKRIGKGFRYPHPRSASIDHLLPLSLGGDDTALNKRAAHLRCNVGRNNGRPGEQLPLPFGVDGGGLVLPHQRKAKPAKPCLICGEPLANGKCDLHLPVWFKRCERCGNLFAAPSSRRRCCGAAACEASRWQRMPEDAKERQRQRNRDWARQYRATAAGRQRAADAQRRWEDKRREQGWTRNGGLWSPPAAPVQGAQGGGPQSLRQPVLYGAAGEAGAVGPARAGARR